MILDNLFARHDILGAAMQASQFRNQVISNNIANADTPGFKKSTVLFEDTLIAVADKYNKSGEWDLSKLSARSVKLNKDFEYRLDENNVDMEVEMTGLYKNAARYDALALMLNSNTTRFNLVTAGRAS
ncbi:MAG: flagellar basal body rod protein FlgB [Clostridiales bacterium]|jgi:flagellar basal-body rod protein FlgB|nr:flagellar basal body rod protein FlgB [Clostridiales bacterium]